MLFVIFGLPGAGKSYTGKLLEKHFGFFFYDGDNALPEDMRNAINTHQPVSDAMRNRFFASLLKHMQQLEKKHTKLVVAQTYIKDTYRKDVREAFKDAQFFLVTSTTALREKRLKTQHTYPLNVAYVRKMVKNFEKPTIQHTILTNTIEGENSLYSQLSSFLGKD